MWEDPETAHPRFSFEVKRQPIEAMIAAGRYVSVDPRITAESFPIAGGDIGDFEGRYFHLGRNISSWDTIRLIRAEDPNNPWETARLPHILAVGAKFPEEPRQFKIAALGSGEGGYRTVPCLGRVRSGRALELLGSVGNWPPSFRFLAVRRISESVCRQDPRFIGERARLLENALSD